VTNKNLKLAAAVTAAMLICRNDTASAENIGPPPGAILDLAGIAVTTNTWEEYSLDFTATLSSTNISFAFRNDPTFFLLDDVSVTSSLNPTVNLIQDGGFEQGARFENAPPGWTFVSFGGASDGSEACECAARTGSFGYTMSNRYAYNAITQAIDTDIGASYKIDFWLDTGAFGPSSYQQLASPDDGYNGMDFLVYAGAVPTLTPKSVPEPGSLALFGAAALAGFALRRRPKVS
jgi:hypothetical protein